MVFNPNANRTARTLAAAKNPVYYVAIEGLTTKHFSTAPVRAAAVTKKALLNVPDSIAQKIFQLQGKASLNTISFELTEKDGEILDLIATDKSSPTFPTLLNRAVTLYSGYADLNESDYAPVGFGQIDAVEMTDKGLAFKFSLVDLRRHQFDDLFRNASTKQSVAVNTKLAADAAVGATSITVLDATDISGPSNDQGSEGDELYLGPSTDGGYTGQELKVRAHTVNGNVVGLETALTKAFKAGDEVRWPTSVIEGNPINIIYALLTGDFSNGTFPLTRKRGELTGLGIAAGSIDAAALQKERDRAYDWEIWRFEIKEPVPGFKFLEQQICRFLGYPITTIDGKLSFRLWRAAWPDDAEVGLPTLLKADIKRWRWRRAHELHVNRCVLGVELDPETGEPHSQMTLEDTADQAATKETISFEEDNTGFRDAFRGARIAEAVGAVVLRRYVVPPPQIEVWCHLTKRAYQLGEDIALTHDEIPNTRTGTRGLTGERLEIVEREENFAAGEVRFILQTGNYSRPAWIGEDGGATDYNLATDAEKESAWIGPDAGPFLNDGLEPYEIC